MATRPTVKFDKARPITVRVPGKEVANVEALAKILRNALGQVGCPACLSGYVLTFTDLPVLVADERFNVRAM